MSSYTLVMKRFKVCIFLEWNWIVLSYNLLSELTNSVPQHVNLFFLWPRLRHDITRHAQDQGPMTFNDAILIAQRIEASTLSDSQPCWTHPSSTDLRAQYQGVAPMDIDVQNMQLQAHHNLPNHDDQGRPKCFYCNNYGHARRHCRKLQQQSHKQQVQITMADATSLVELLGNWFSGCWWKSQPSTSKRPPLPRVLAS